MAFETKLIEVRDHGTFMPLLAIKLEDENITEQESWLLGRCGYGRKQEVQREYILFLWIGQTASGKVPGEYGPRYDGGGTKQEAIRHICSHWDKLHSGSVVDVAHLRGERDRPADPDMVETRRGGYG